jgi:rhodanese-related sulfurtransferase
MYVKRLRFITLILIGTLLLTVNFTFAGSELQGIDSKGAYKMVKADPSNTFIVDVRTKAEYEFVGHPDLSNGVPNIPLSFYPTWEFNKDFVKKVEGRYTKDSTIITICRSGKRAQKAAQILLEAGFKNVLYMTDSFEGSKDKNGHRTVNGWKVNGLPYTYTLNDNLVYK